MPAPLCYWCQERPASVGRLCAECLPYWGRCDHHACRVVGPVVPVIDGESLDGEPIVLAWCASCINAPGNGEGGGDAPEVPTARFWVWLNDGWVAGRCDGAGGSRPAPARGARGAALEGPRMVKLMCRSEVLQAWRLADAGGPLDDEIGQARLEGYTVATGRARCRACGEKIAKGLRCIDLLVSFDGSYNGWTAVEGKLHLRADCPAHAAVTG